MFDRPRDGGSRRALDLPDRARGVLRGPPLHRAAAQPRDRAQHPLGPSADAHARRDPGEDPLPRGARALRVQADRDGPRPVSGDRVDHALGRRLPGRRGGAAAAPAPPGVRPPRRADDGLQPLRRGARPPQGDARARAGRTRRYRSRPMTVQDTTQLCGGETTKAVDNFPVSGERVPVQVVRWLGRIKGAAARANADLGLLDADVAKRLAAAADEIAEGKHDDQFPIDVFQTGSGTSSNMNANEVIATLAGEGAHANDHVNMGQSSNDVFPSAVHLAALDEATHRLVPALARLEAAFAAKADEFADIVKSGRTHLMDAVPVTLGQEFSGYAAQVRLGRDRVAQTLPRVGQIPLGGTATGTGLNTHEDFAAGVRAKLSEATGLDIRAP